MGRAAGPSGQAGRPTVRLRWLGLPLAMLCFGCASSPRVELAPFTHPADTLGFRNETLWSYSRDPQTGRQVHERREPPPDYTLRCFVLARVAKQFHAHARFEPGAAPLAPEEYRRRFRRLQARSTRTASAEADRIVFPGYADLRGFSQAHEAMLRAEAGGAWQSYFQRGQWRMVLPFSRAGQAREAARLVKAVRANTAPVLHVFTFPGLTVNHAVVLFSVEETASRLVFQAYDPNAPDEVLEVGYDRDRRQFSLPATAYFVGGPVNAYEVYCRLWR
ncbi:MAG TPA: hypothetical protein VMB21_09210 [Candidatus Limnocylindria bacterium]|nr:hypothetical protein [Candidatus Limnocylindria bacterium]